MRFVKQSEMCDSAYTYYVLRSSECSQEFYYYLFLVKLDRYVGSCNSLKYLSNKVCVPNKTEHLDISVFTMKNCNKAWIMRM